ncbi:MAG: hypothetical protein M3P95_02230 [Actinomycetota bacterium]|nr:hypothetical protein [Actinomycetota bacterium]
MQSSSAPAVDAAARLALRRQLLVAGGLVVAAAVLAVGVLLSGVSPATADRPLLLVAGLAVAAVLRAARSLWRVQRRGIHAALPAPPEPLDPAPRSELDEHDAFLVAQRFRLLGDRYELSLLEGDGRSPGERVAVVEREAFAARERLEALSPHVPLYGYADASVAAQPRHLFVVRALQLLDVGGRFRVDDGAGRRIGELRKLFTTSLWRSTWEVWDGAGRLVATAQERSLRVALLRRALDLLPVVGELLGLLPIPYHFDVRAVDGSRTVATLTRLRGLRDRYVLIVDGDPEAVVDRRLALALAVSLDALQSR